LKQLTKTYHTIKQDNSNHLFPVFLKLEKLSLLLIGGGHTALEKLRAVLHNSPHTIVRVVSNTIEQGIHDMAEQHTNVELVQRDYIIDDIDTADIILVAVGDEDLCKAIQQLAKEKGKLVNVAGRASLSDFHLGSIVDKGDLKIAISTNGKSPATAKQLKEVMQETLPGELHQLEENLDKIRGRLNGNFNNGAKVKARSYIVSEGADKAGRWRKIATYILLAFALMLVGHFIFSYLPIQQMTDDTVKWYHTLDANFHWMILAGFLAQLVDGALGMGYGVTSATILNSAGIPPAAISGSIHTAEMFASGASGYSHYRFGNVNKKLFKALLIPGIIGAVLGAILLTKMGQTHLRYLRPIMAAYTMLLGIRILVNAFRINKPQSKFKHYGWLAGVGGFLDSFGGGGWGPIVTTTLITKGRSPKYVIGSVSLTEFFVTLASAFTFFTMLGVTHWQVILALVVGGLIAAPLAARLAGRLPKKTAFILLGLLVIIWSLKILVKIF
jgi:hypothetical protein